jgi:hypothetical protein
MAAQTTTWAQTKHQAIQAFNGELPNAITEQMILEAFQAEPLATLQALHSVIEAFKAGRARSGWAVWKSRIVTITQTADVTVDAYDRPNQVRLTEQWIRNSGGYLDRIDELHDACFGPHGRLYLWDEDQELIDRIHALWQEQRPRFHAAEVDSDERIRQQAATLKRLRKASSGALTRDDAELHAQRIAGELARLAQAPAVFEPYEDDEDGDEFQAVE